MDQLRSTGVRLLLGVVSFVAAALALTALSPRATAVPFQVYAVLGVAFSLAFVIFGRPLFFGFGGIRLRVLFSYLVSALIIAVVLYTLVFIQQASFTA